MEDNSKYEKRGPWAGGELSGTWEYNSMPTQNNTYPFLCTFSYKRGTLKVL